MNDSNSNQSSTSFSTDRYLSELRQNRLAVWRDAENRWQPIPAAVTPVKISRIEWNDLTKDAHHIIAAFLPLQIWLQRPEQKQLFELLYGSLSPLEKHGAALDAAANWGHATIRLDLFWHGASLKIIEANCTIPAMQAYSDIIRKAWIHAGGSAATQSNNTHDLLQSLLSLYQRDAKKTRPNSLAILHRPGDSQLAELQYFETMWQQELAQTKVFRLHPNDLEKGPHGLVDRRTGESIDLIYRHCFAWRLAEHKEWAEALMHNRSTHVYNPLSAHFEIKAFLALLSHVSQDPKWAASIGLSAEQIDSIHKRVPNTRIVSQHLPQKFSQYEMITDQIFEQQLEDFVVKKSIGYGGHQVIMGSEWYDPANQRLLTQTMSPETGDTKNRVDPIPFLNWLKSQPDDLWIIQDRMSGKKHQTKIIQSDGSIKEIHGFVDASIFLNTGTEPVCSGGVSRIAVGPVVNIGTGGGLAPLLIE